MELFLDRESQESQGLSVDVDLLPQFEVPINLLLCSSFPDVYHCSLWLMGKSCFCCWIRGHKHCKWSKLSKLQRQKKSAMWITVAATVSWRSSLQLAKLVPGALFVISQQYYVVNIPLLFILLVYLKIPKFYNLPKIIARKC